MRTIIGFLVDRGLVVNLVSVFLIILGLYAALTIHREAFPNVNLDMIQVNVVYPGTSPKEIEQLIITPIEQELRSLNGIDKMISMSFPSSGRIILEVDADANNRERITNEVNLAINRADLPSDLREDPLVVEIDGSVFPIIRLALSAPTGELGVKRLGDDIKDDLLNIKGVAQVTVLGDRKAEIRVTVDPKRMAAEHISVGEIARSIQNWNLTVPGGDIDTDEGQKVVRVVGEFKNPKDAANLVLRANQAGNVLRLADVATVTETLIEPTVHYDVKGEAALSMLILKQSDADIIDTVDRVRQYVTTVPDRYGAKVEITAFQDFSRLVRLRLGVLTNNGMVGLVLVFVSLLLFLRFSVAMTTTWGLPIIFMSGIFILFTFGVSLNMISMMGFIMVLGMLVDDAIIIGENITWHMEQGMKPRQAAITGAVELIGPVTTTILTTIAAFIPMMFMTGLIGKFIFAIPVVVITLLTLSWLESFLILPSHVAHVTHPDRHPPERRWIVALEDRYSALLARAIRFRWITVAISFAALIATLALAKTMPFQLFPPAGVEEFVVRVTAPPGTSLDTMRQHLRTIDKEIRSRVDPKYLESTLQKSGDISVDLGDPLTQRGSRYGQIRAIYISSISRPEHDALEEMHQLAQIIPGKFPNLDISFTEIRPGPPLGRALEAEISSYDQQASEQAARRLIKYLKTISGITAIDSGLKRGDDELHLILDRELATYADVDLATAAQHVKAASGGLTVSVVRHGTEEIDVTIRYPDDTKHALKQLMDSLVPNKRDGLVPLHKIARLVEKPGYTTIRHKEGTRVINVVADTNVAQLTSVTLNGLVRDNQDKWLGDLTDKVKVGYGGEEEKNRESFVSLVVAFGFAMVGIFFILAIQFNNLSYPFVVMLAIPFGAIGIIVSFYLHDLFWKPMPLSFMTSLGMIALTGVVVNSSLVLLVFIQRARQAGMEAHEAIIKAGRRRLRAVILTAITTIVGLLPTAYGWGGLDPFVSPMALALSWGLVFATLITLITIPATLAAGLDVKNWIRAHVYPACTHAVGHIKTLLLKKPD
ncbi:MAG: efflux RND transporter permease subunit [Gammaproteobacteria bacterium]|nr:efflux RND transporter permease subunit [Gammaproteobacteria bacterium]